MGMGCLLIILELMVEKSQGIVLVVLQIIQTTLSGVREKNLKQEYINIVIQLGK